MGACPLEGLVRRVALLIRQRPWPFGSPSRDQVNTASLLALTLNSRDPLRSTLGDMRISVWLL